MLLLEGGNVLKPYAEGHVREQAEKKVSSRICEKTEPVLNNGKSKYNMHSNIKSVSSQLLLDTVSRRTGVGISDVPISSCIPLCEVQRIFH